MYRLPVGPGAWAVTTTVHTPGPHPSARPFTLSYTATAPADQVRAHRLLAEELTDHRWHWAQQVHGAAVVTATSNCPAPCPGHGPGDAVVATLPAHAPAVLTADCVPVALASCSGSVRVAIHAGRPGLLVGTIGAAIAAARALTDEPLYARIGPHICAQCYEVDCALAEEVYLSHPEAQATTSWGTPALDLTAMALTQLRAGGVVVESEAAPCTREDLRFPSHRRLPNGERLATAVLLRT
ncbi:MAG: polyphenol oxidase family protein [Bowdeniella nasicola]|nr:polyphenol oxidase family protein [Bowdeniella nasicola]